MVTPTSRTYGSLDHISIYGGMNPPSSPQPAWMTTAGVALNKLVAIPGSTASGTPFVNSGIWAYSGFASKLDTCELFSTATGGHGDSSDNGVYSIKLSDDSPVWVQRTAPTPVGSRVPNVSYQPDGKPTSRHTYDRLHYIPAVDRVMMVGGENMAGNANTDFSINGWCPTTNQWDAQGTYIAAPPDGSFGMTTDLVNNLVWLSFSGAAYNPVTNAYVHTGANTTVPMRFPTVMDTTRNILFCCQFGNGVTGIGQPLNASKLTITGTPVQTRITFNSSAAYTQFLADNDTVGIIPGMTYDDTNDVFYWYNGQAGQENHLYVIHPNNGSVWDMTMFSFASGSATMTTCAASGMNGRVKYFPLLKGVAFYPTGGSLQFASQPLFFLKTS